jgi:hypothetical protein
MESVKRNLDFSEVVNLFENQEDKTVRKFFELFVNRYSTGYPMDSLVEIIDQDNKLISCEKLSEIPVKFLDKEVIKIRKMEYGFACKVIMQ